jgi:predicted NAD/FAD-dependent oxidoreductase
MTQTRSKIAIIGAGMAGLSCASALATKGHNPVLFDKGRGPGGRMATRRAEVNGETLHFDHGAQFFCPATDSFAKICAEWSEAGVVEAWPEAEGAAGEAAMVGVPGMNGVIRHMAAGFDVHWGERALSCKHHEGAWHIDLGEAEHVCEALVLAIPAEQAAELMDGVAPEFASQAASIRSDPSWTVMAGFAEGLAGDDVFRGQKSVAWAARNSAKPQRVSKADCWVIQATANWSKEHLELSADEALPLLLEAFFAETGRSRVAPVHAAAHRWRYAFPHADGSSASPEAIAPDAISLWEGERQLGLAGDWLATAQYGPKVEAAWLSGQKCAAMLLDARQDGDQLA